MVQAWNVDGESVTPVTSHLNRCGCSLTGVISDYLRLSEINMKIHENCPSKFSLAITNLTAYPARIKIRYFNASNNTPVRQCLLHMGPER